MSEVLRAASSDEMVESTGGVRTEESSRKMEREQLPSGCGGLAGVYPAGPAFVSKMSVLLQQLATAAEGDYTGPCCVYKFNSVCAPPTSVSAYILRLYKYFKCSEEVFVFALIYLDRVIKTNQIKINNLNIHRLVLAASVLGAKFLEDVRYSNKYYARVGGVCLAELNRLEMSFLKLIRFDLSVSMEEYTIYRNTVLLACESDGHVYDSSESSRTAPPLYMPQRGNGATQQSSDNPPRSSIPGISSKGTRQRNQEDNIDSKRSAIGSPGYEAPQSSATIKRVLIETYLAEQCKMVNLQQQLFLFQQLQPHQQVLEENGLERINVVDRLREYCGVECTQVQQDNSQVLLSHQSQNQQQPPRRCGFSALSAQPRCQKAPLDQLHRGELWPLDRAVQFSESCVPVALPNIDTFLRSRALFEDAGGSPFFSSDASSPALRRDNRYSTYTLGSELDVNTEFATIRPCVAEAHEGPVAIAGSDQDTVRTSKQLPMGASFVPDCPYLISPTMNAAHIAFCRPGRSMLSC